MLDTIRKKLFFYSPLIMCVFIWTILYFTNPDTLRAYAIHILVMYMVMRFFWQRHLKQTGQHKGNSFGLWGILYGAFLCLWLLYTLVPKKETFVIYQSTSQVAGPERDKDAVNYKTSDYMNTFFDQLLVCGYLVQEGQTEECKVMATVELDNNPDTYEVFALTDRVRDCLEIPCTMFLAQMTKDAMTAARAHQEENAPKVEGKMINKWQVTNAVTQINKELHNGWQTFQFELNGTLYVWEYDEQSQRYMQR